jgi:hypothetical protein
MQAGLVAAFDMHRAQVDLELARMTFCRANHYQEVQWPELVSDFELARVIRNEATEVEGFVGYLP